MRLNDFTFVCGDYVISLKKFQLIDGHDDSLPYTSNVYANNKLIATAFNDGWGGITSLTPNNKNLKIFNEVKELAKVIDIKFKNHTFKASIDYICDDIACRIADKMRIEKIVKKYEKECLIFEKETIIKVPIVENVNNKIKQISVRKSCLTKKGRENIKNIIDKYTSQGYSLLNKNITFL